MSHWTHFITEEDIANTAITGSSEVEVFHFSFNNPEALRNEIIEMLAEEAEDIAIAEQWEAERVALCNADNEAEKAEWKEFLDSLPAWQRQWDEAPLRRLKERKDAKLSQWDDPEYLEALESEARRAELEGLSVCGADEWGKR